jgi:hypothetical protein
MTPALRHLITQIGYVDAVKGNRLPDGLLGDRWSRAPDSSSQPGGEFEHEGFPNPALGFSLVISVYGTIDATLTRWRYFFAAHRDRVTRCRARAVARREAAAATPKPSKSNYPKRGL